MSQQLPQLLSGFGLLGVALGTIAAVAVPFAGSLLTTGKNADSAKSSLDDLQGTLESVRGRMEQLKGIQEAYRDAIVAAGGASTGAAALVAANSKREFEARKAVLGIELEIIRLRAQERGAELQNLKDQAKLAGEMQAEFRKNTSAATGRESSAPFTNIGPRTIDELMGRSPQEGAAAEKRLLEIRKIQAELDLMTLGAEEAKAALDGVFKDVGGAAAEDGKSGGGGGGKNKAQTELERLRDSLKGQVQLEMETYALRQEQLRAALEQKLITQQEYQAYMEEAARQHAEKMAQLDSWRYGTGLEKAKLFFGGMADALSSGNEKMQAAARKFAAVEALINAWRAYAQTLADPSLPFFAKFAAAAKVLAAGFGAVNAIKGGGRSGGGSAAATAPAASTGGGGNGTFLNLQLLGSNFGEGQVRDLIGQINKAIENGAVLKGIRTV